MIMGINILINNRFHILLDILSIVCDKESTTLFDANHGFTCLEIIIS